MSDESLSLVLSAATDGGGGGFDEWCETVHVPDVLTVPGVVADHQLRGRLEDPPTCPAPPMASSGCAALT